MLVNVHRLLKTILELIDHITICIYWEYAEMVHLHNGNKATDSHLCSLSYDSTMRSNRHIRGTRES